MKLLKPVLSVKLEFHMVIVKLLMRSTKDIIKKNKKSRERTF